MKPSPCIVSGCYKRSVAAGRCETHKVLGYATDRKARLPEDWSSLSKFILHRDKRLCHICKDDSEPATEVDHIIAGDNHSPENLAAVHQRCHRSKTAWEGNQAKKDQRPQIYGTYWLQEYHRRQLPEDIRPPF